MASIFTGFLVVFFNLKINEFDLLADFVGYAIMYSGMSKLSPSAPNFGKAKPWTIVMIIDSLVKSFGGLFGIDFSSLPFIILNLITTLISLYVIYLIDTGVGQLEQSTGFNLGSDTLLSIWKMQAASMVVVSLLVLISFEELLGISLIFIIAAFIAHIAFLVYINKAKKILAANGWREVTEDTYEYTDIRNR